MYEWLKKSEGHVIGIRVFGKVTREDYEQFVPVFEDCIEEFGQISLLAQLDHVEGIEAGAVWEDVKFDMRHLKHIERFAVVGDAKWEERLVNAMNPFIHAECRFFDAGDIDEAWRWLHEGFSPRDEQT